MPLGCLAAGYPPPYLHRDLLPPPPLARPTARAWPPPLCMPLPTFPTSLLSNRTAGPAIPSAHSPSSALVSGGPGHATPGIEGKQKGHRVTFSMR
jgi:hypothetical protein